MPKLLIQAWNSNLNLSTKEKKKEKKLSNTKDSTPSRLETMSHF